MSESLDELVRESRPDLGTREARQVDWARVDRGLFGRIASEQRVESARLASGRGSRWVFAAGGLAVAAAVALVVGTSRSPRSIDAGQAALDDGAGTITAVEGGGQMLVDGKPLGVGGALHAGDVVEARGAQVTLERPGKLTLVFERGTRATVTHVQGSLVLALEEGAVEAQVVPVPNGEAFAVDVGTTRVAVHGTHLRVARAGEHVVVDLSEGVISVGDAPRIGSTLGALVTAPAHAEFSTGEADAPLAVSHDPAAVRAPVSLGASGAVRAGQPAVALAATPKPETGEVRPSGATTAPRADGRVASPSPARPGSVAVAEVNPEAAIVAAVRSCLAERPRADNVTVEVSTTVRLTLGADGSVSSARFDPPVAPDVNACAAGAIYKTRFSHGGSVAIPVELKLPSSAP